MAEPIDFADPCAVCKALKQAKVQLALGQREAEIYFKSGDDEQRVRFEAVKMTELDQAIAEYEGLCAAAGGDPGPQRRRFAMRFGARRRGPPNPYRY